MFRYKQEVPDQPAMPAPVLTEHPIDPELQSGDSSLLGGAIELNSPWKRE